MEDGLPNGGDAAARPWRRAGPRLRPSLAAAIRCRHPLPPAVVAACMDQGEAAPEARPRCSCRSSCVSLVASRCMERLNTGTRARGDRPTGAGAFPSAESMHAANAGRLWQRTVSSRAGRLGWRHGAPLRAGPVPWQRTVGNGAVARHAPGLSHHRLGHQARPGRPVGARSGSAQSSPASSPASADPSGVSPLSARSRLIRSTIGGWVEKSPLERASNFLIGFVK